MGNDGMISEMCFSGAGQESYSELRNWIQFAIADITRRPVSGGVLKRHVTQLGLDSVKVAEFISQLSERMQVPATDLKPWEHDTLGDWIDSIVAARQVKEKATKMAGDDS